MFLCNYGNTINIGLICSSFPAQRSQYYSSFVLKPYVFSNESFLIFPYLGIDIDFLESLTIENNCHKWHELLINGIERFFMRVRV